MKNNSFSSVNIVDFHSHILPSADHGSSSTETSLIQLQLAATAGIDKMIATPHFYPANHSLHDFLQRRDAAWEKLSARLTPELPDVRVGAEVLICNGLENLPGLEKLFIKGTNTLLLELPFNDFQYQYVESAERLIMKGVNIVLAHADRYPEKNINEMLEVGCKIQLNADSLDSIFMNSTIKRWLNAKKVVALGSDVHHRDKRAFQQFERAKKKLGMHLDYIKNASDAIWAESER